MNFYPCDVNLVLTSSLTDFVHYLLAQPIVRYMISLIFRIRQNWLTKISFRHLLLNFVITAYYDAYRFLKVFGSLRCLESASTPTLILMCYTTLNARPYAFTKHLARFQYSVKIPSI